MTARFLRWARGPEYGQHLLAVLIASYVILALTMVPLMWVTH